MDHDGLRRSPSPPPPAVPDAEEPDAEVARPSEDVQSFDPVEFVDAVGEESNDDVVVAHAVLTNELRDKIVRQVEYYFSDENLPTDKFMLKFIKRDKEGFVPISLIASFRRMKRLVNDLSLVEASLRTSSHLIVSSDGKRVRRLHPLKVAEAVDTKPRTVLVENLPKDCSVDSIREKFSTVGNITKITLHDPYSLNEPASGLKTKIVISSKVHALVEFETVEAAETAVSTLNDEKNWRSGMRVEMLLKRMGTHGLAPKGQKGNAAEKNNGAKAIEPADNTKINSAENHDELAKKEDEEQLRAGRRNRYRGRGKGHSQPNATGQGHRDVPSGSSGDHVSKPILGPRMPDGTRGFTLGRGKPASSSKDA